MKPLIRNTLSIAAAVALGLSGCTQDTSDSDYKNVSQDVSVSQDTEQVERTQQSPENVHSEPEGSTSLEGPSIDEFYQSIDSLVEQDPHQGLAYSPDRSSLFLIYNPETSILYLQLAPETNTQITLDPFLYGFTTYDSLDNPHIERPTETASQVRIQSSTDARAILEIMPEVYAPSLYQESAFNPDIITFGYDVDALDEYIRETERYPINDSETKQIAIDIMQSLPEDSQENPYQVLDAVQDWTTEHEGTTQGYVTLARTYGIPAREVEAYTAVDGQRSLAMVYLEPYGWLLTDPQENDTIREFGIADEPTYFFKVGTNLQEKGVSIHPLTTDVRHEQLDPLLEDIVLYRQQDE